MLYATGAWVSLASPSGSLDALVQRRAFSSFAALPCLIRLAGRHSPKPAAVKMKC